MIKIFTCYFFFIAYISIIYPQNIYNKTAGVGFRVDDNHSKEMFNSYADIFKKYGYHFTFALNLSEDNMSLFTDIIPTAKELISAGNEMGDHTPSHTTKFFRVPDVNPYYGLSGVDHIMLSRNAVCLKWGWVNTQSFSGEKTINIKGDVITAPAGEFANIGDIHTIYFNNTLFTFDPANVVTCSVQDTIKGLMNFWGENVNLPEQFDIPYDKVTDTDIHMSPEAIRLLVQASLDYCSLHDIPRPHTWLQPGGYFPQLWKDDLAPVIKDLGYTSAATYNLPSNKFFNDYNPQSINQFAMQWGDFDEETNDLASIKNVIANRSAQNEVTFSRSHFLLSDGWDNYLLKIDSLLAWCSLNNLPVYTYSQWADILYNTIQNPLVNIIPQLNRDINQDGNPDGYSILNGTVIDCDDFPVSSNAKKSLVLTPAVSSFQIKNLGGLEKGQNYFSLFAKGNPNSRVNVSMYIRKANGGSVTRSFIFNLDSSDWEKFELVNSESDSSQLFIPEDAYSMQLTISGSNFDANFPTIKIADMELRGFGSVSVENEGVVNSFNLSQNYPNPFNPTTTIKYSINKPSLVTLNVYDMLGRKVSSIINEFQLSGKYSVQFNAVNLASGIYFYRLEADGFSEAKKLVFIK